VERQVWGIDTVGKPKSGYGRTIDIPDRLLEVLKEGGRLSGNRIFLRSDGKPWTPKTIRRMMKRLQTAAGLEPRGGIHILRHTFCTRLASNWVDIRVIKEMAGHTDVKTTMRYLHIVKGAKAAAAATLNTPLPEVYLTAPSSLRATSWPMITSANPPMSRWKSDGFNVWVTPDQTRRSVPTS
jgi:integrase